ncbi:hypothetical protein LQ567_05830 [Niabella pedocola]|uniref:Uncharacterized protein n=1 Tax=Niabella pedocola TaxID=1752077 RepID=A0ABS8PME2_9BACT|nr:hypothetical protein [Niabella pedocola]MCD2422274.1 hypothetical protein [Niabella pedocola]
MHNRNNIPDEDRAPLLGSWTRWYVLMIVVLLLLIACFYWITKNYS